MQPIARKRNKFRIVPKGTLIYRVLLRNFESIQGLLVFDNWQYNVGDSIVFPDSGGPGAASLQHCSQLRLELRKRAERHM